MYQEESISINSTCRLIYKWTDHNQIINSILFIYLKINKWYSVLSVWFFFNCEILSWLFFLSAPISKCTLYQLTFVVDSTTYMITYCDNGSYGKETKFTVDIKVGLIANELYDTLSD